MQFQNKKVHPQEIASHHNNVSVVHQAAPNMRFYVLCLLVCNKLKQEQSELMIKVGKKMKLLTVGLYILSR
jgi:hypothetical protein